MTNENQSLSSGTLPEQLKELLHRYEDVCKKLEALPKMIELADQPMYALAAMP